MITLTPEAISGVLLVFVILFILGEVLSLLAGFIEGTVTIIVLLVITYVLFSVFDPLSIEAGREFLRTL